MLDALASGVFSPDDPKRYQGLVDLLYNSDWFMVVADFAAYLEAQAEVDRLWMRPAKWHSMTIANTANMAWFSADRTIRDYAWEIWNVPTT